MVVMKLIKAGLGTIASTGAAIIVRNIANNAVNRENICLAKKICVFVGASVIGMMVGDAVDKYVGNAVDDLEKSISEIKNAIDKVNKNNSEEEENG